jgi:hypothetical protein
MADKQAAAVMQLPATLVEWTDGSFTVVSEMYGSMNVGGTSYKETTVEIPDKKYTIKWAVIAGFFGWVLYGIVRCAIERPTRKMRCLEITLLPKK